MFFIWTVPGPSTRELITLKENIIRRTGVRKQGRSKVYGDTGKGERA